MQKLAALVLCSCLTAMSLQATVLYEDYTNYPSYTNGCIEGQGGWYAYSPKTPVLDALLTNNVLILNATNKDSVATPTNGWVNGIDPYVNYASFTINVSQLPSTQYGGYFCQLQDNGGNNDCHVFIDTLGTSVPGTYRLGIGNYSTSFNSTQPPNNYPLDLSTGVTYNVVILFDNNQDDPLVGATLWINPSLNDYENAVDFPTSPDGFVFGTDTTQDQALLDVTNSQIGFSPYADAGISNVTVATTFSEVNITNPPAFGIQPQSGTNYSGNSTAFYGVASGVDVTYQWFSTTYGALVDDGVNIIGSTSNILVLNNLSASDNYYVVATDAYGNTVYSTTNTETVITTPTAPFFPPALPGQQSIGGANLTNNLFTSFGLTNVAEGSGLMSYQWYFAPSNTPSVFSALPGQTNAYFYTNQLAYANGGYYYVAANNGDGITAGPTNYLVVLAPLIASIPQLHTLMQALTNQIIANDAGTVPVNTNQNVTVSGYVSSFGATSKTNGPYSEFFIQNGASGLYVYYSGSNSVTHAIVTNIDVPPPGSYVTISGYIAVFDSELEIEPLISNPSGITTNTAVAAQIPAPVLGNFNELVTNPFSQFGINSDCSLVTFTNIYIYTEGARAQGYPIESVTNYNTGNWKTNNYSQLYITQGPYNTNSNAGPINTNIMELFVPAYMNSALQTLWGQPIPTNCYQLTGIWVNYEGSAELEPTRPQDFVVNPPSAFAASAAVSNGVPTLSWPAQAGSTYSVYSATNLLGPWTQTFGLSYYPSTGTFTDTNKAPTKFYQVSSP